MQFTISLGSILATFFVLFLLVCASAFVIIRSLLLDQTDLFKELIQLREDLSKHVAVVAQVAEDYRTGERHQKTRMSQILGLIKQRDSAFDDLVLSVNSGAIFSNTAKHYSSVAATPNKQRERTAADVTREIAELEGTGGELFDPLEQTRRLYIEKYEIDKQNVTNESIARNEQFAKEKEELDAEGVQ